MNGPARQEAELIRFVCPPGGRVPIVERARVPEVQMRKHLATIAFSVTLLACNSDSRSPVGPLSLEPNSAIVDAVNGGREGFYFLHPFVTKPGVFGPFDATLTPRAR